VAAVISTTASIQRQPLCGDLRLCIHPVLLVHDWADVVQRRVHPCLLYQNNARQPFGNERGPEELAILHVGRNRKTVLAIGGDPSGNIACRGPGCRASASEVAPAACPGECPAPAVAARCAAIQTRRLLLELTCVTPPLRLRHFRYPFALKQPAKGSFCRGKVNARNAGYKCVKKGLWAVLPGLKLFFPK
jgi:hypothetical protein